MTQHAGRKPKKSKLYLFVPLILGALFMAALIWHYRVNTPFWDEWDMVSIFQKVDHHTLGFGDLWHQHNEHRIFFPLIILVANAYLTHWNIVSEMFISLVVATVTVGLLIWVIGKQFRYAWIGSVAASLTALWFFSPVQWQNWLWGSQLVWFLNNLGVVASILLLYQYIRIPDKSRRNWFMAGALTAAFISTFSLANGILIWAVGLMMLVVTKQGKKPVVTWTLTGVIATGLYYYHLSQTPTPNGPALTVFLHHPLGFVKFFVALMGDPVGSLTGGGLQKAIPGGLQLPLIIGSTLLLLLVPLAVMSWQRRRHILKYLPWLALIMYAVLCALLTAYGRLGYELDLVFKSRYTSFTLLYVIGITVLALIFIDETVNLKHNAKALAVTSIVLVSLPVLASSYWVGLHNFRQQSLTLKQVKACTSVPQPPDSCLASTYPYLDILRPRLDYVKLKHLGGY